jgi:hypothetical protein
VAHKEQRKKRRLTGRRHQEIVAVLRGKTEGTEGNDTSHKIVT